MEGRAGTALRPPGGACLSGEALGNLFFATIIGLFLTAFVVWVIGLLRGAPVTSLTAGYIVWGVVAAALWWVGLYGDIHGWWTSGWGE